MSEINLLSLRHNRMIVQDQHLQMG
uniref:Uncharacterized protein n=1 Tax=Rhizophora mucronata TaxID=61149 RepID=A0A2P2PSN0_RHIMU